MAKMRWHYNFDTWKAATITASSEAGDLVAENAVDEILERKWRTTGCAAEWIQFDLGSAQGLQAIWLVGGNLTEDALVKLQANSSASWGSPPVNQTIEVSVDADGVTIPYLGAYPNIADYRYVRMYFEDPTNPDGYLDFGEILGTLDDAEYYEPARNMTEDFEVEEVDPSTGDDEEGTQSNTKERTAYRKATLSFQLFEDTQREKFRAIYRKVGRRHPLIVDLDPDSLPNLVLYCKIRTSLRLLYGAVQSSSGAVVLGEITS